MIEALALLLVMTVFFAFILHLAQQQKQLLQRHRFSSQPKEFIYA